MGCGLCPGFVGKWEGKEKEKVSGKNDLKSSSSLPLHVQRRRSCTVLFKTAPCRFFFFFFE